MPSAMKITASFSSLMQQNFQSPISSKLNSIFEQVLRELFRVVYFSKPHFFLPETELWRCQAKRVLNICKVSPV